MTEFLILGLGIQAVSESRDAIVEAVSEAFAAVAGGSDARSEARVLATAIGTAVAEAYAKAQVRVPPHHFHVVHSHDPQGTAMQSNFRELINGVVYDGINAIPIRFSLAHL